MRARLVVFIFGVAAAGAPAAASAQSTPTEREAAAGILRQIDSLQAKIEPTAQAQRLVAAVCAERDRLLARVEALPPLP